MIAGGYAEKILPVRAKVRHDTRVPNKYATDEPQTIMSCIITQRKHESNPTVHARDHDPKKKRKRTASLT